MFLLLLKKQMLELFRGYVIDRKTGKLRPKKQIVLYFLLFVFVLAMISQTFLNISSVLANSLLPQYDWLYFAILGGMTFALGIFGSVFTTYSVLYVSKDNDFLLSMPIRPSVILNARMASVYILSIIFEAVVYFPAVIEYYLNSRLNALNVIFPLLNFFISGFAVLALTCFFGWLIAFAASRVRNKNAITVVFSLAFLGIFYFAMFRFQSFVNLIGGMADELTVKIKKYAYILYVFGRANTGSVLHFILFAAVSFVLLFITFAVMSKTFIKLSTANKGMKKKAYDAAKVKSGSIRNSLFKKELARFLNTPIYLMNSGLGILIAPIGGTAALIKREALQKVLTSMQAPRELLLLIPAVLTAGICLICSMDNLTAPSVSLEGKSLWILRSLPVNTKDVLGAKIKLHFVLNSVSAVISVILFGIAFGLDVISVILMAVSVTLFILLTGAAGLLLNLKKPDFMWVNETIPVKQDPPVILAMLVGLGSSALGAGINAAFGLMIHPYLGFAALCVAYGLMAFLLIKKVNTKGVRLFEEM